MRYCKTGSADIRSRPLVFAFFWIAAISSPALAEPQLGSAVTQLIVGIAPTWDSMTGKLQRLQKVNGKWERVGAPMDVLFGKHGLAWGRGEIIGQGTGPTKVERDNRAPAGVFKIGAIYTYDQSLPTGSDYPFHTVRPGDAWVDDTNSPNYNQYVRVDPENPPAWYAKAKMRLGDFAYRWLVEIRHNSDPPVPGYGSAIFFHIRRGPTRPSAGCTTMAESNLITLIRWLRLGDDPHYVCLPRAEYLAHWKGWALPDPETIGLF
ncbi:MAG TPA: L,D-transpeptidase family protein [Chthoniobacterales bacterium]|nr:L,D-transpeptidase family protein [Chthoniobacterales bacterium]